VQEYAYWSEALHGVNAFWGGDAHTPGGVNPGVPATSFPSPLAASLSWDPALLRREATAISDEARGFLDPSLYGRAANDLGPDRGAYGSLFYFAPTVNMDRDPRWGRADETYGEDPLLTAVMGSAFVQGMQGETAAGRLRGRYLKTVTTLKHYALNNVENDRMGLSSDTDEGTIRDYYTRQFRDILQRAHAAGVMSSYNAIDGTPAVANALTLNVLLRRTFGFRGYVTSDCGAVGTQYRRDNPAAKNPPNAGPATALLTSGHDWAPPGWSTNHADQAAVWHRNGTLTTVSGRAGAEAWSLRAGTALNCVGDPGQVGHPAFWDPLRPLFADENRREFVAEAIRAGILSEGTIDRALLPVFTQRMRTGEFDPRSAQPYTRIGKAAIESPAHRRLAQTVARETLTLLQNRRPRGAKRALLPASPRTTRRVVVVGDQAGKVFLGDYSGSPREQVPLVQGIRAAVPKAAVVYDDAKSSTTSSSPPSLQSSTKAAIRRADLVVVMVGTDQNTNAEGYDRKTLALPGNYGALIDQVAALGNRRIVLVDQSAGPVDLRRARTKVAAILFSAANGQRQGLAAADAIFGRANPSGHLSFTWYAGDAQLPAKNDYDLTPARTGGRGRTYMHLTRRPAYPFGFGRSYTRFRYSRVRPSRKRVSANGTVRVAFRITNTGRRAGATVAQLYAVPPRVKGVTLPRRRLVTFARTRTLRPGRSQTIRLTVPVASRLRLWSARRQREVVYRGLWRLRLARSASDVVRSLKLRVTGAIGRSVATVALAPPSLVLAPGASLDLRGRNPWLDGLAPTSLERVGDTIVSAVRRDDTFVDVARAPLRFRSNRPGVVSVDAHGTLRARAPGVAVVTVRLGKAAASTVFVVAGQTRTGLPLPLPGG
jgi:beta-glucosidase-like glycosyl hydrolase